MSSYDEMVREIRNTESMDRIGITKSNDQLREELGACVCRLIDDAGFVLVPKRWREDVFKALDLRAKGEQKSESAGQEESEQSAYDNLSH